VVEKWSLDSLADDIITGAQITMGRKQTAGPPASIEYFEPEIRRVVGVRRQRAEETRREVKAFQDLNMRQHALHQIAKTIGWNSVNELSENEASLLAEQYLKGELQNDDLYRLKMEIEARPERSPSAYRESCSNRTNRRASMVAGVFRRA
jgi:hypothetical protein